MAENVRTDDDKIQHGIDDDPNNDGKKGLGLGAIAGGAVGGIAGSMLGPAGAVAGAAIGGSVGSVASGAAVDAVDAVDNDNTVTGIGDDTNADTTQTVRTSDNTHANTMPTSGTGDIGNDVGDNTGRRTV